MKREAVDSSNIKSVGYDKSKHLLEIEFKGGGVYQYRQVTIAVHVNFMRSFSKGKYFHRYIKDTFPFVKV